LDGETKKPKHKEARFGEERTEELLKLFYEVRIVTIKKPEKRRGPRQQVLIEDAWPRKRRLGSSPRVRAAFQAVVKQIAEDRTSTRTSRSWNHFG